jgi:hypothetical protein
MICRDFDQRYQSARNSPITFLLCPFLKKKRYIRKDVVVGPADMGMAAFIRNSVHSAQACGKTGRISKIDYLII